MGKRQIGELELSELVTTFLISELAGLPIADSDIPPIHAIAPILLIISLEIIISFSSTKIPCMKKLFDGQPSVLVKGGKLNIGEMNKQRVSVEELLESLRLCGIGSISDADTAFLEQNGKLSAFKSDDTLTMPIIVDGKIHKTNLSFIGKDEKWLAGFMKEKKHRPEDVFVFCSDGKGCNYIIYKEEN